MGSVYYPFKLYRQCVQDIAICVWTIYLNNKYCGVNLWLFYLFKNKYSLITQCNKFRSCHVHDWKITLSYSICPEKILFFCEKLILCSIFEQNSIKVRKNSVLGGFRDTPHPPMGVIEFFGFMQKLP